MLRIQWVEPTQFLECSRVCHDQRRRSRVGVRQPCRAGALMPYICERPSPRVSSDGADKPDQTPQTRSQHLLAVAAMESTFIMIKPDGVQRGLVSIIFPQFVSVVSIRFGDARALGDPIWYKLVLTWICYFFPQIGEIISRFEKKGFYLKGNLGSMFWFKHPLCSETGYIFFMLIIKAVALDGNPTVCAKMSCHFTSICW